MNLLLHLIAILCISTASTAYAGESIPSYATSKQIQAMAPCTATLTKRISEYSSSFTSEDGKSFIIGDARGEQWVWHFASALKLGQTCKFPGVFLGCLSAPNCAMDKEITAMPPCEAKLATQQ